MRAIELRQLLGEIFTILMSPRNKKPIFVPKETRIPFGWILFSKGEHIFLFPFTALFERPRRCGLTFPKFLRFLIPRCNRFMKKILWKESSLRVYSVHGWIFAAAMPHGTLIIRFLGLPSLETNTRVHGEIGKERSIVGETLERAMRAITHLFYH